MRLHLTAPALAVALALTACGSDSDTADDASTTVGAAAADTTGAVAAAGAELNDADVEFAQGMIAHHEQAIEMAEIALDPNVGAGPEVVDLATRIAAAQEPEVETMTAWLEAAGEPIAMDTSDGHDMSSMAGMMSAEDMDELATLAGDEFDQRWLEMMIEHHEGAISQAETVLADGANADVAALAEQIISAQQGEIEEMRALLAG